MTDSAKLIIYADEEFLLPVVIDAGGKVSQYGENGSEERLWLYFFKEREDSVIFGKTYRDRALAGEMGFVTSFWDEVVKDPTLLSSLDGWEKNSSLLLLSSITKNIKRFWQDKTNLGTDKIPTVYLFSDAISYDKRKAFIGKMEGESFSCIAYTPNPTELFCDVLSSEKFTPSFGDNILVLSTAPNSLRISSVVWDGKKFISDGQSEKVDDFGDSPLKKALVEYVLKAIDRNKGYLNVPAKMEAEIRHQMQNAKKWLSIKRKPNGDFDIDDFRYSFSPDLPHACTVKGDYLAQVQQEAADKAIAKINNYVSSTLGKKPSMVLFSGEAFEDQTFLNRILARLEINNYRLLTDSAIISAISHYDSKFPGLKERFGEFDSKMAIEERDNKSNNLWIKNASSITSLKEKMQIALESLDKALLSDRRTLEGMIGSAEEYLKKSLFDDARLSLYREEIPTTSVQDEVSKANSLLRDMESKASLFENMRKTGSTAGIIAKIQKLGKEIGGYLKEVQKLESDRNDKLEEIRHFKEQYPLFQSLKKDFESTALGIREKRDLLRQMMSLTKEELPKLDLEHVEAIIEASISKEGGFFKKKEFLDYKVNLKGRGSSLPCNAFLIISSDVIFDKEEDTYKDAIRIPIDSGKGGELASGRIPLPDEHLRKGGSINLYLYASPEVMDRKAVYAPFKSIEYK